MSPTFSSSIAIVSFSLMIGIAPRPSRTEREPKMFYSGGGPQSHCGSKESAHTESGTPSDFSCIPPSEGPGRQQRQPVYRQFRRPFLKPRREKPAAIAPEETRITWWPAVCSAASWVVMFRIFSASMVPSESVRGAGADFSQTIVCFFHHEKPQNVRNDKKTLFTGDKTSNYRHFNTVLCESQEDAEWSLHFS